MKAIYTIFIITGLIGGAYYWIVGDSVSASFGYLFAYVSNIARMQRKIQENQLRIAKILKDIVNLK